VLEGTNPTNVLAVWTTETDYSEDVTYVGADNDVRPMQLTPIAIEQLKQWNQWDPPLDYKNLVMDNLRTGARFFQGIVDNFLIPRDIGSDQAYAVYNAGLGGYQSATAQRNLERFKRNRETAANLVDCVRDKLQW
jgi:hypothetical protein